MAQDHDCPLQTLAFFTRMQASEIAEYTGYMNGASLSEDAVTDMIQKLGQASQLNRHRCKKIWAR